MARIPQRAGSPSLNGGGAAATVPPFLRAIAYAIARICYRPSVCLSHGWITQKRLKLGLCNFHHTVAPSL